MQGKGAGPVNRVELESQVLCAALRQSLNRDDQEGSFTSVRELSYLFPDLLPPAEAKRETGSNKDNYYEVLGVKPQASSNVIIARFLHCVMNFLRKHAVSDNRQEYNHILNAGFILRKPRLRLSHDLVIVRRWLSEGTASIDTGSLQEPDVSYTPVEEVPPVVVPAEIPEATQPQVRESVEPLAEEQAEQILEPKEAVTKPVFIFDESTLRKPEVKMPLPLLIQLLVAAQFIGSLEVKALKAQMQRAPNIRIERLILNAGYVTPQEMNSLLLAQTLLGQGQITMGQFQVAMYDERMLGLRMAESLQVRGWLTVEVRNTIEEWQQRRGTHEEK